MRVTFTLIRVLSFLQMSTNVTTVYPNAIQMRFVRIALQDTAVNARMVTMETESTVSRKVR